MKMQEKHIRNRYISDEASVYGHVYESTCGGGYDEANQAMDGLSEEGYPIEDGIIGLLQTDFDVRGLKEAIAAYPEVELQPYLVKAIADEISEEMMDFTDGDDSCCYGTVSYRGKDYDFVSFYDDASGLNSTHQESAALQILMDTKVEIQMEVGASYKETAKNMAKIMEQVEDLIGFFPAFPNSYEPEYHISFENRIVPHDASSAILSINPQMETVCSTRELIEAIGTVSPAAKEQMLVVCGEAIDKIPLAVVQHEFCELIKIQEQIKGQKGSERKLELEK